MVEHNLAKVGVASSNLVSRSNPFPEGASFSPQYSLSTGWVAEW